MSLDPAPQPLLAVHDLLRETLAAANDSDSPLGYGLALYPRSGRFDAPVFGVLTSGGESTILTYRLLQALIDLPVYISGRVAASVRDGITYSPPRMLPSVLLDQPVLRVGFTCDIGATRNDLERTMPLESTIFAGDLTAPIILLTETRPVGWPG